MDDELIEFVKEKIKKRKLEEMNKELIEWAKEHGIEIEERKEAPSKKSIWSITIHFSPLFFPSLLLKKLFIKSPVKAPKEREEIT